MNFRHLFDYLRDLEANNDKAYFRGHRDRYDTLREDFIAWVEQVDKRLQRFGDYDPIDPRGAVENINNNLLYHPDKPTYKSHFGASFGGDGEAGDFYVKVGLRDSMIGVGLHHPASAKLKTLRAHVDAHGDELARVVSAKAFRERFGALVDDDKLKTSPRGYDADHEHIAFLRLKSFAAQHDLTQAQAMSDDFVDEIAASYKAARPLLAWIQAGLGH